MLLCSRPGKPGFVFCAFYPLFPGERVRVRDSGRTELHTAPGGLTRCARPAGSLFASLSVCPTGCASCRTPVGGSHSPQRRTTCKKKPAFSCELFFKYGGEGGIDSLRSPCGQPVRYALSLSNWLRQLSNPGRGFSFPPKAYNMRKKSPHFHASSSSNMAVRGGFEPPIRCRIHTFQACSFSHSDTSPYCFAA